MVEQTRRVEHFKISLSIAYESWWNDTPFTFLNASMGKAQPGQVDLYQNKRVAVRHKWEMMRIAGAELNAVCDYVVARNKAGIPLSLSGYLTLKIESFLLIARSLLDVLSTCLAIHQLADGRVQSFNKLRDRGDCPDWLKQYAQEEMVRSAGLPLSKTGWLSLLMTQNEGDQSLRDFVAHRGIAKYSFRELPSEEGWELIFQPRSSDEYVLPIKGVVQKILDGVDALAALADRKLGPSAG